MIILESKWIYLRELTTEDTDMIYKLHNDPQVMTFMPYKNISYKKAIDDTNTYINLGKTNPGLGIWATVLKETDKVIGWTCLKELLDTKEIEIGYRYFPSYWNKGYCTEICNELIKYGFQNLNLDKIIAIVHPENIASVRVLEKLGLEYNKDVSHFNMNLRFYKLENTDLV